MSLTRHADRLAATAAELRRGDRDPAGYLDELDGRVAEVDPEIHALLPEPGRPERVRAEVAAVASEYPDPAARPPLFCVPVGVKDIFHVRGMWTRANSEVPPAALTGPESVAVSRLREAGAVVAGKTVTTEFAYAAPGPTRNPHDPGHTPGGSSSGSAAGVAAGLFPLALGSQTGGSVLRPAAYCGIVGFKPTYDRIPIDGVLPLAPSLDHVGFFTRDVAGARLAAAVLCDDWEADGAGWRDVGGASAGAEDPGSGVAAVGADRPVLGVPDDAYLDQADAVGRRLFEDHLAAIADAGYEVRRTTLFADAGEIADRHQTLMSAEAALAHEAWFDAYGDRYREQTAELVAEGRAVPTGELAAARAGQDELRERVAERMAEDGIDCWAAPAAPGPAPEGLDSTGSSIMNRFFTYVGLPAVSVPAGTHEGLPVGVQFVAGRLEDERLLGWADGLRAALEG